MKEWTNPEIVELDVAETACTGSYGSNYHGWGSPSYGYGNNTGCGSNDRDRDNRYDKKHHDHCPGSNIWDEDEDEMS